jgi:hypothetical protein
MDKQMVSVSAGMVSFDLHIGGPRLSDAEAGRLISFLEEMSVVAMVTREDDPEFGSDSYKVTLSDRHLRHLLTVRSSIQLAVDRHLNL